MAVTTLRPSADGTTTGWSKVGGTGTFASSIVDDPDTNDADTSYVLSPNVADGTMFVELDDVPGDFDPAAINSITLKIAHRRLNTPNMAVDAGTVNAFLTRSDESTAISTTPTAVSSPIQAGYDLTSLTPSPTGTHTVADWNGARLALVFDHTTAQTLDTVNQIRITAAEVVIDYTPAANVTVTPGTASLTTTTFTPTVTVTQNQLVTPGTASLTLTAFAPTVSTPRLVTPGIAALTLTTFAPTVSVSSGLTLTPDAASLTLTPFTPSVAVSDNKLVTPGVASLTLTAFAPTVTTSANQLVTPGLASLTLTAYPPTVTGSAPLGGHGGGRGVVLPSPPDDTDDLIASGVF